VIHDVRYLGTIVAGAIVLAISAGAVSAAAATRLSPADREAISAVVDRFVKDVVLRENLREGWDLAGPDLRGGTTRAAWISGKGVTVASFPARGTSFRDAWVGRLVAPGHLEGSLILHPKAGSHGFDQTAVTLDVRKLSGRWVVDIFYSAAVFRSGSKNRGSCGQSNCAISGPADYGPQGSASAAGNTTAHVGAQTFLIGLAVAAVLLLLMPFLIWARVKRRDARARAAYEAHDRSVR
jgi:hypothetical protein